MIDSAASAHMCMLKALFCRYKECQRTTTVYLGDNGTINATRIGDIEVELMRGGTGVIKGVLHVPMLARNLLSVGAMADLGLHVEFKEDCIIKRDGHLLLRGQKEKGLYTVKLTSIHHRAMMAATHDEEVLVDRWHHRFGDIPTMRQSNR